jgi:hypothetical protein
LTTPQQDRARIDFSVSCKLAFVRESRSTLSILCLKKTGKILSDHAQYITPLEDTLADIAKCASEYSRLAAKSVGNPTQSTFTKENPRAFIRQVKKAVPTTIRTALMRKIFSGYCCPTVVPKYGRMIQ